MLDARALELGRDVAVVCSGDNVDMARLLEITQGYPGPESTVS
jgi:hypothetical protein